MSKKDNSRALRDYGLIEEYHELGASPKTIARLTGLSIPKVKKILMELEKKKRMIRGGD